MAGEWPLRPLRGLTENFDSIRVPVKEADRRAGPYPYYGASGIVDYVDGYLLDGEYLLIAEDGENLRTRTTPVAFLARGQFWVNNHAHVVRGNSEADTRYLMYALAHLDISGYLTGSTMPKLTQDNMNRIPVPAPPPDQQRAIAHILGTLDDRIELNRRMNGTLEAMARAIFKSWFADFDPVRAKMGRNPPFGMDAATAALFPDSFEDSPLGKIPSGWKIARVGDFLTTLETGSRPQGGTKDISEGVPSVGAESIEGLGLFEFAKTKMVTRDFFAQMKRGHVSDGDVLLYKDGGRPGEYEPHVTMVGDGFPFREFCINEHVYRVRTAPALPQPYLYLWLTSDSTVNEMRNRGTGVAVPGLNSTAVRELPLLVPSGRVVTRFEGGVAPLVHRIFSNCNESCILAAIRDALLPKLISGEIPVKDDERTVGRAV